jgi:hypothetical protein
MKSVTLFQTSQISRRQMENKISTSVKSAKLLKTCQISLNFYAHSPDSHEL